MGVFALSLIFVFLVLAGLYESWSLPFSVLLSVPIAVFGGLLSLLLRKNVQIAKAQFQQALAELYKALGGGWQVEAAQAAAAADRAK